MSLIKWGAKKFNNEKITAIKDLFEKPKTLRFNEIVGKEDIKNIFRRAIDADANYNILLTGPPGCAKTLFLKAICTEFKEKAVYFDGANLTNYILDYLELNKDKIRYICIDEIDKLSKKWQGTYLNFLEDGTVNVQQQKKNYDFKMKNIKVFATSNKIEKLSDAIVSRFDVYNLEEYSYDEFLEISIRLLPEKYEIIPVIASKIWYDLNIKDIRKVIQMGKLVQKNDKEEDIDRLIETKLKYGAQK